MKISYMCFTNTQDNICEFSKELINMRILKMYLNILDKNEKKKQLTFMKDMNILVSFVLFDFILYVP